MDRPDEPMREVTITYLPAGRDVEALDEAIVTAASKALGCTCEPGSDGENCQAGEWVASSRPFPDLYFFGTVLDAGGGEVQVRVDRDTESYPPVGARLYVEVR